MVVISRSSRLSRWRLAVAGGVLAGWLSAPATAPASVPVTCGQVYSGDGHLTANCTGTITITKGSLNLAGFTVFGTGLAAVDCQGACTVYGPGTVAGAGSQFGI